MSAMNLLPTALSEMFLQVTKTKTISKADQYGMLTALLDDSVNEHDLQSIDRILYAVRRGRVQVVDELSTLQ
ncbi:MAG: hypothetical protein RML75_12430 [Cyanobacteriota bacterium SKYGB_h_bin112]|nr:hypothetical protein [Cyanobacteriota bacterium SKYGB_h_bin112]